MKKVKYHINPETGNPNICRASSPAACPFGAAAHYDSKPEARTAYEAKEGEALNSMALQSLRKDQAGSAPKSRPSVSSTARKTPRRLKKGSYEYPCPNPDCKIFAHDMRNKKKIEACNGEAGKTTKAREEIAATYARYKREALVGQQQTEINQAARALARALPYTRLNKTAQAKAAAVLKFYQESDEVWSIPTFKPNTRPDAVVEQLAFKYETLRAYHGLDPKKYFLEGTAQASPPATRSSLPPNPHLYDTSGLSKTLPPSKLSLAALTREVKEEAAKAETIVVKKLFRRKTEAEIVKHTDRHEELQDYIAHLDPKARDYALLYRAMSDDPTYGPNALKKVEEAFKEAISEAEARAELQRLELEEHIESMISTIDAKHG